MERTNFRNGKEAMPEFIKSRRKRRNRIRKALNRRAKEASKLMGAVRLKGNGHVFKTKEIESEEAKEAKVTAMADPSKAPDFVFIPCRPLIPYSWRQYKEWRKEGREPLFPLALPNRSDQPTNTRSVMTVEAFAQIVNDVQKGCFRHIAYRAAGFSGSHGKFWDKKAREVEEKIQAGDAEETIHPYHLTFWHFSKAVAEAEGKARRAAEQIVFLMDPRFWLRFGPGRDKGPEEPGWTERVEIAGKGGTPVAVLTIEDLMQKALLLPAPAKED